MKADKKNTVNHFYPKINGWKPLLNYGDLYFFLLIPVVYVVVFHYIPIMYKIVLVSKPGWD